MFSSVATLLEELYMALKKIIFDHTSSAMLFWEICISILHKYFVLYFWWAFKDQYLGGVHNLMKHGAIRYH